MCRVLAGAYLIHPAVAHVGHRGASIVQHEQRHRGAHLLLRAVVLGIESVESVVNGPLEHIIGEQSVAALHAGECRMAHGLAHGGARHLTSRVSAHAVAEHEKTVGQRLGTELREQAVLLMRIALGIDTLAELHNAVNS